MYSEEFVKYLLKYQNGSSKPVKREKVKTSFNLDEIKKKYATVPIISK